MFSFETAIDADANGTGAQSSSQGLLSPFAPFDLRPAGESTAPPDLGEATSPFTEAFAAIGAEHESSALAELLFAEFDDELFSDALEAVANEAGARYLASPQLWNEAIGTPVPDPSAVNDWIEGIADRAEGLLAELETRFADRTTESIGDDELDRAIAETAPSPAGITDPADAQEMLFGSLLKKVKKVAGVTRRLLKRGVEAVKKFHPFALLLRTVRQFVRPLLRKVLATAIGKPV